ncbi:hypothetical protein [Nostoc sp. FACHB-888]|uniref:hypothetical protein n=1 Tax=Nostoc sp. FACHB-888 TaxID=2692842 RepID=UPI0016847433|nr:hypothetical protein [Nostoc sp. FACHB-888]MBD2248238.1 hypothetical protein [Nostoc sp. FACHB-888]
MHISSPLQPDNSLSPWLPCLGHGYWEGAASLAITSGHQAGDRAFGEIYAATVFDYAISTMGFSQEPSPKLLAKVHWISFHSPLLSLWENPIVENIAEL